MIMIRVVRCGYDWVYIGSVVTSMSCESIDFIYYSMMTWFMF